VKVALAPTSTAPPARAVTALPVAVSPINDSAPPLLTVVELK
jgi:hypothetical protein